jgi:hypothetical protein
VALRRSRARAHSARARVPRERTRAPTRPLPRRGRALARHDAGRPRTPARLCQGQEAPTAPDRDSRSQSVVIALGRAPHELDGCQSGGVSARPARPLRVLRRRGTSSAAGRAVTAGVSIRARRPDGHARGRPRRPPRGSRRRRHVLRRRRGPRAVSPATACESASRAGESGSHSPRHRQRSVRARRSGACASEAGPPATCAQTSDSTSIRMASSVAAMSCSRSDPWTVSRNSVSREPLPSGSTFIHTW